jgi:hypothetical protein
MKKLIILLTLSAFANSAFSQDLTAKEKAETIARDQFSKAKYKKKEKHGVSKELNRVVTSTPVVYANRSSYEGNYVNEDFGYKMEIRTSAGGQLIARLSIKNHPDVYLRNASIKDAYFHGLRLNAQGKEEAWEGALISRNDNGTDNLGLGLLLPAPVALAGLEITKVFLKKVSP